MSDDQLSADSPPIDPYARSAHDSVWAYYFCAIAMSIRESHQDNGRRRGSGFVASRYAVGILFCPAEVQ